MRIGAASIFGVSTGYETMSKHLGGHGDNVRQVFDLTLLRLRPMTQAECVLQDQMAADDAAYEDACERFGNPPVGQSVRIGTDGWYNEAGQRLDTQPRVIDAQWSPT